MWLALANTVAEGGAELLRDLEAISRFAEELRVRLSSAGLDGLEGVLAAHVRIRSALERRRVPCVAVSPLIGGRAVRGPAAEMSQRLQGGTSAAHLTQCYPGLIDVLVIDGADAADADAVSAHGVRPIVSRTLMSDASARRRLAETAVDAVALA